MPILRSQTSNSAPGMVVLPRDAMPIRVSVPHFPWHGFIECVVLTGDAIGIVGAILAILTSSLKGDMSWTRKARILI